MVDFDKYTGPAFLPGTLKIVLIAPVERLSCLQKLADSAEAWWGTTIHR